MTKILLENNTDDTEKGGQVFNVVAGTDAGNRTLKIMIGGHWKNPKFFMYDNVTAKADEVDYEFDDNNESDLDHMLDITINSNGASTGKRFLLGEFAKNYRKTLKERENNKKTQDPQLHLSTLAAIANSIVERIVKEEQSAPEEVTVNVNMCTGLPYEEWRDKISRAKYESLYLGNHTITFEHKNYPIRKVILNVKKVEVEIEGLPALKTALGANKFADKYEDKKYLVDGVVAMVDIGCYTSDMIGGKYAKVGQDENGIKLAIKTTANLCTGISIGVGTAAERTIKSLVEKYPYLSESITNTDIFTANIENGGILSGNRISIEPYFTEHCYEVGKEIGEKFVALFDMNGFKEYLHHIYICGGGSKIPSIVEGFNDTLRELRYDAERFPIENLQNPNPVHANTFGYYLTAKFK